MDEIGCCPVSSTKYRCNLVNNNGWGGRWDKINEGC